MVLFETKIEMTQTKLRFGTALKTEKRRKLIPPLCTLQSCIPSAGSSLINHTQRPCHRDERGQICEAFHEFGTASSRRDRRVRRDRCSSGQPLPPLSIHHHRSNQWLPLSSSDAFQGQFIQTWGTITGASALSCVRKKLILRGLLR